MHEISLINFIEGKILTQNISKKEKFEKMMEEAKQAILMKIGPDDDLKDKTNEDPAMFQDSQDPYDLEDDDNMAEFYAKMYPEGRSGKKISSDSESVNAMELETDNMEEDNSKGSKKKKGKSRRKG